MAAGSPSGAWIIEADVWYCTWIRSPWNIGDPSLLDGVRTSYRTPSYMHTGQQVWYGWGQRYLQDG